MEEADQLADDIAVIDRGKVIARGTSDELKSLVGGERLEIIVAENDIKSAQEIIDRVTGSKSFIDMGLRKISAPVKDGSQSLIEVVRQFDTAKIHALDLAMKRPSLDDVFMSLTGHAAEEVSTEGVSKKKGGSK